MFPKIPARQLAQTRQQKSSANIIISPSTHSDLEEAFIGHSYDSNSRRGVYSIFVFGTPKLIRPTTMLARSDWEVQLTAILEILKLPLGDGPLIIYSSDEALMAHLDGGSVQRWRENGWRRSNGEPLQHPDLLAQIAAEMTGRSVEFGCDPTARIQREVQAEAKAALKAWRNRSRRKVSRC